MNAKQFTQTSKSISYLLRHGAEKEGVSYRPDGFILIKHVLNWLNKSLNADEMVTFKDIETIVANDNKGRYTIEEIDKNMYIRANQGHSFTVKVDTTPITLDNVNDYGVVLHGTFQEHRSNINATGLNRMSRQHVHMVSLTHPDAFKLMRPTVDLFVQVDVRSAIIDGYNFSVSENNVILCEGNKDGFIPRKYLTFLDRVKSPCSGVIVIGMDVSGQQYISLVRTPKNHWSFPKGKKNKGETSLQTALREMTEETGLTSLDLSFAELPIYQENSDKGGIASTYYTAFYKWTIDSSKLDLTPEDADELVEAKWVPMDKVINWKDSDDEGSFKERRIQIAKNMKSDLTSRKLI